MTANTPENTSTRLDKLRRQVEELAQVCQRLKTENHSLRNQQQSLSAEREKLIQKNELARTRVEAMIQRLKTLETE